MEGKRTLAVGVSGLEILGEGIAAGELGCDGLGCCLNLLFE